MNLLILKELQRGFFDQNKQIIGILCQFRVSKNYVLKKIADFVENSVLIDSGLGVWSDEQVLINV